MRDGNHKEAYDVFAKLALDLGHSHLEVLVSVVAAVFFGHGGSPSPLVPNVPGACDRFADTIGEHLFDVEDQ